MHVHSPVLETPALRPDCCTYDKWLVLATVSQYRLHRICYMQVGSGYRVVHGIICERVLVNYLKKQQQQLNLN